VKLRIIPFVLWPTRVARVLIPLGGARRIWRARGGPGVVVERAEGDEHMAGAGVTRTGLARRHERGIKLRKQASVPVANLAAWAPADDTSGYAARPARMAGY
jgi:hypothetical protein